MSPLALSVRVERWPIAGSFAISRGAKTEAVVVVAELSDGSHRGRGECVPYARYGETVEGVAGAGEGGGPARRATRSTARSGIWRPNAPHGRCTSFSASRRPSPSPPP